MEFFSNCYKQQQNPEITQRLSNFEGSVKQEYLCHEITKQLLGNFEHRTTPPHPKLSNFEGSARV